VTGARPPHSPIWARALALNALSDPRFVPIAIALLFAALATRAVSEPFGDQDAGWLAATGRSMLETLAVPRTNGFAITDAAVPWVVHEWALAPLYAVAMARLGLAGPVCLGLVAGAITTTLLATATVGRSQRLAVGALTCIVSIALARECLFEPRPAYLVLGAPIAMLLLTNTATFSVAHGAACIALALAWANVHGSFPLGLGVLALGAWAHPIDRARRAAVFAAACASTLVTPYGVDLLALVGRYVGGGDPASAAIHAHIAEFQPLWAAGPVFGGPTRVLGVALVAGLGVVGARRGERAARCAAIAAVVLAGLAVVHARHVPQAVTLGAALLVPTIDRLLATVPLEEPAFDVRRALRRIAIAIAITASIAIAITCARGVHADEPLGGDALPSLARDPRVAHANAYVAFDASGRFLWLAPDAHVLFDPRNDCYRGETALIAYAIEEGDCTGRCLDDALLSHDVEVALVPEGHPTLASLRASSRYEEVRTEGAWHLFATRSDVRR